MKKNVFLTLILLLFFFVSYSQLTITDGQTADELAEILSGDNITVNNCTISGDDLQHDAFEFTGDGLDVSSGVILSTGDIFDAVGPNSSDETSTGFNLPGNPLLSEIVDDDTYDAVVFQLDFKVQSEEIEFNYIFLSEEYNEYVGSEYNDVFAFFISGPGIDGEENIAIIPGTTIPVAINTINNDSFWQFYNDNESGGTNIEFDGFTTLMTAKKEGLIPCETYTLKLMIADTGDDEYDSGVLLQEGSFVQTSISATATTFNGNDIAIESCIESSFDFALAEPLDVDVEINYQVGGTALMVLIIAKLILLL